MSANRHLAPGVDTTLLKTQAIHALIDAHVDPLLVVDQCCEVIRINDLQWDDFQGNVHEFRVW